MAAGEELQRRVTDNGGSRPIPDPTALTDAAIARSEKSLMQYIDGQLGIRDERLRGIDEATVLRLAVVDSLEEAIESKVGHLASLHGEKFNSIGTQFTERDTRSENEKRDSKVAVDAAFAAQKEAAAAQDKSNREAIDKSEKATAETIKTNQELNQAKTDALTTAFDDLKDRVGRIESVKVGSSENRTNIYALIFGISGILAIAIAVIGLISGRLS